MSDNIITPITDSTSKLSPKAQAAVASTASADLTSAVVLNDFKDTKNDNKATIPSPLTERKELSLDIHIDQDLATEGQKNYFVKLPHSGYEFDVRGLLVREEDEIKSSNTSTKRAAETIMKTLYNCISDDIKTKDHPFGRFETFCKSISLADRDAICLAVIEKTYESTHEMNIRCPRCGKSFDETICLPQCMHYKFYDGKVPILERRQVLEFPNIDGKGNHWTMYLKIPTLADELKTLSVNEKVDDLQRASEYIFVDRLDYSSKDNLGRTFNDSISNYIQIYGMIKEKPAIIRKRILKEFETFAGDWGVRGSYETTCKSCDSPITVNIVPISHFLYLVQ